MGTIFNRMTWKDIGHCYLILIIAVIAPIAEWFLLRSISTYYGDHFLSVSSMIEWPHLTAFILTTLHGLMASLPLQVLIFLFVSLGMLAKRIRQRVQS